MQAPKRKMNVFTQVKSLNHANIVQKVLIKWVERMNTFTHVKKRLKFKDTKDDNIELACII